MNRNAVTLSLGISVLLAGAVLMAGATSGWVVGLAGFFFVIGGTLLTAVVSESFERVEAVLRSVPEVFRQIAIRTGDDENLFLHAAENFRRGSIRRAEMYLKGINDPFLRQGSQLILDGCSRDELNRSLLWQLSNAREKDKNQLKILYAMAGFAPAFGMLGTLLGLVRMLFSLGDDALAVVGAAMGFAMVTTVYGLVASNLVLKPVAIKMERRLRESLAWKHVRYELMLMLLEKEHPTLMRESIDTFTSGREKSEAGRPAASTVSLAQASQARL